ncbi:chloride channel protein [Deinococcus budaensis]|uniref:H+/Cl- antiporter ClcA n=1 Tax=Deinococcus budaensis TaxID=1665626 RepID=A0A7W8LNV9_9DEIO|nr:chloride channel protein [Deinococcus budaensis]MBB5233059.1 H+/Cl- antiporter ClcA [Deinococcus budaensis]
MRSPLPRAVLTRLETGRLVVLSGLLGVLVGGLCVGLRLTLNALLEVGAWITGYAPPGTPGEGGLLMAFGQGLPWGLLLALPLVGAACAWLVPRDEGDPLNQLVRGYHARGPAPDAVSQGRTLLAAGLGYASGLLVGRDSPFTLVGGVGARLLGRATRLDTAERRTLTLAGAAAALGAVLHAPLAAAVLVTEVLYRRFEFEFEVLMPCVLASVAAYAVYGLAFGFSPLLSVEAFQGPALAQLGPLLGVALGVTLAAWGALLACRVIPDAWTAGGRNRVIAGGAFGLLTAALAVWSTPAVLGDGSGWTQLGVSGFLGPEALGVGAWRWLLLALGARLAFGGGVLPSVGVGGLLGVGLGTALGVDPAAAALVGAVAFLTVTLNAPIAAALLAVAWSGDALLPAALLTAGLAHVLSGETGLLPAQARSRAASPVHAGPPPLPEGVRFVPRRPAPTPATLLHAPAEAGGGGGAADGPAPLASEQELYRRAVPGGWQGARLSVLSLPPGVEVVGVVRGGAVQAPRPQLRLTADDELVFLARPDAYAALEGVLRLPGA